MTTRTFPSITPSSVQWGMVANTRMFTSPLTGAIQTVQRAGQRWVAELTFNALTGDERGEMEAFVFQVLALSDNFYLPAFGHVLRGAGGGTPLVDGASQTGNSLTTDGWPLSTEVLKAGDYFEVGGELKRATADVTSDGAGDATVSFVPELRSAPADNAALTLTDPVGIFRLSAPSMSVTLSPLSSTDRFASMTLSCVEDVLA